MKYLSFVACSRFQPFLFCQTRKFEREMSFQFSRRVVLEGDLSAHPMMHGGRKVMM